MINFKLDIKSGVPFHRQITDQIKYGIASGRLLPGEQLPTVRELAVNLSVNPNTVRKAYSELDILGVLNTQQGTGTFISEQKNAIQPEEKKRALTQLCDEFVARGQQYNLSLDEIIEYLENKRKGKL
jgi:GntR family transcriptional regulator